MRVMVSEVKLRRPNTLRFTLLLADLSNAQAVVRIPA